MQFAFSYFYYAIGAPKEVNATEVFDEFDTDGSGYVQIVMQSCKISLKKIKI